MTKDIDAIWTNGVGVSEITDTDLLASRGVSSSFQDPDQKWRRVAHGILVREELENESAAVDFAIRLHLANLFDRTRVEDRRDEYDIKYLIPPNGWILDYEPAPIEETTEVNQVSDDLYWSLPQEVHEMISDVVQSNRTDYDYQQDFVRDALARWSGGVEIEDAYQKGTTSATTDESVFGITKLCKQKGHRQLLEFFLTDAEKGEKLTKSDLVDRTGLSRQTIHDNLIDLVVFDIVEMVDSDQRKGYNPDDIGRPYYRAQTESETFKKANDFANLLSETYERNKPL